MLKGSRSEAGPRSAPELPALAAAAGDSDWTLIDSDTFNVYLVAGEALSIAFDLTGDSLATTAPVESLTAQAWQAKIQKLVRIFSRCGPTQAIKEGLQMMGLPMSDSRHPIMPGGAFRREDREELRIQLENLGKIPRVPREFDIGGRVYTSDFPAIPRTPARFEDFTMKVGEGFAGPPFQEVAHIDLLLGLKDGPVGRAMERALAESRPGHELRVICERPRTLLVPTVTVRTKKQRRHVYEEAARGVNLAIEHEVAAGVLPQDALDDLCMIANVFVHPAAAIRTRVAFNNYKAMRHAIRKALENRPQLDELLNEKESARHPFRYAP